MLLLSCTPRRVKVDLKRQHKPIRRSDRKYPFAREREREIERHSHVLHKKENRNDVNNAHTPVLQYQLFPVEMVRASRTFGACAACL